MQQLTGTEEIGVSVSLHAAYSTDTKPTTKHKILISANMTPLENRFVFFMFMVWERATLRAP